MAAVGSYEAKTHLPQLLERVARGERITITKHGVPVAVLAPAAAQRAQRPAEVIEKLRRFRRGRKLGRGSLKQMIEEGRR
jgi:prevent-host-death family protein